MTSIAETVDKDDSCRVTGCRREDEGGDSAGRHGIFWGFREAKGPDGDEYERESKDGKRSEERA